MIEYCEGDEFYSLDQGKKTTTFRKIKSQAVATYYLKQLIVNQKLLKMQKNPKI